MTLEELLRTARRSWRALAAIAVVTLMSTTAAFLLVPVEWSAQTQMVLLTPSNQRDDRGGFLPVNPFLVVGDDAAQVAASAMASIAGSQRFQDGLAERGATGTTAVEVSTSGGGVVLALSTLNGSPDSAQGDLRLLREQLMEYLEERQLEAGAPPTQLYTLADLLGESEPTPVGERRATVSAAVLAVGALSLLFTTAALTARRRRSAGAPDAPTAAPGVPVSDPGGPAARWVGPPAARPPHGGFPPAAPAGAAPGRARPADGPARPTNGSPTRGAPGSVTANGGTTTGGAPHGSSTAGGTHGGTGREARNGERRDPPVRDDAGGRSLFDADTGAETLAIRPHRTGDTTASRN